VIIENKCFGCSKCCEDIILPLGININNDIKQWIEFHNIEVQNKVIKVNNKCSKLNNGRCSIYEQRPNNCKDFFCKDYGK